MDNVTWEQAVRWYRSQPDNERAVRDCYFDLPVAVAAARYRASEEFAEVLRLLGSGRGRKILDLGAGNGIGSYALAHHGWRVTALEPDQSEEVGAGAIEHLATHESLPIEVIRHFGERVPLPSGSFDAVYGRQVLHHAANLEQMLAEVARLLRPGGVLLAIREHVADDDQQLAAFLAAHPLHQVHGWENAFPLSTYLTAFAAAGLSVTEAWGPLSSILNYYPGCERQRQLAIREIARRRWRGLGRFLARSAWFRARQVGRAERFDRTPGRMYSFLARKSYS